MKGKKSTKSPQMPLQLREGAGVSGAGNAATGACAEGTPASEDGCGSGDALGAEAGPGAETGTGCSASGETSGTGTSLEVITCEGT